jgi:FAD/FMN-containing dehydrogenase
LVAAWVAGPPAWIVLRHVVSFEIVTADGRTVRAGAEENPDLYWGLRGGGGNFGVVTEFEFEPHQVTGRTLGADFWFTLDDAPGVMRGWRELVPTAPRAATLTAWTGAIDGEPRVNVGFVCVGLPDDAAPLLAEIRSLGRPVAEQVSELSYLKLQRVGWAL